MGMVFGTLEEITPGYNFFGGRGVVRCSLAHSSTLAWRIPRNRGAWQAAVHGVTESRTQLSDSAQQDTAYFSNVKSAEIQYIFLTMFSVT